MVIKLHYCNEELLINELRKIIVFARRILYKNENLGFFSLYLYTYIYIYIIILYYISICEKLVWFQSFILLS